MTPTERVLDASVLVAFLLQEEMQGAAEACSGETFLVAPELIRLEVASAVAAAVWRKRLTWDRARSLVTSVSDVIDVFVPLSGVAIAAFDLAARLNCSAYDGAYLALAVERNTVLMTSDRRLAERAEMGGLARYVQLLS